VSLLPRLGRSFSILCVIAAVLFFPAAMDAQQSSAAINGNIKDASGAVVEGATITLTDVQTGVSRNTVSNGSGDYVFIDILPGSYEIRVSKPGFNTITQQHVTLSVNQTATYDYNLTIGSTQQAITVEASPVAIEASTSELGTVINEEAVRDLPLNGRNFTQLLTLTPGASPVSVAQNSGGGGGFAGNAVGSFSFPALNGQRNRSNMFLMDGVVDLGSFIGNYNVQPIVDAVQEFKVQSHNDLSEFGQAPGGIVNVATKAGTNSLHGDVWEFVRNDVFDARNFFLASRNPLRQNQFGFEVGGPVYIPKLYNGKNRTFFSGAYEGFRQSQATQSAYLAPTAAQLNGNFSGISQTIYDPSTLRALPGGGYTATPFQGNIIPSQDLNPVSLAYAKALFPTGSPVIGGTNAADVTPTHLNQDTYQVRVDQTFSEHDNLFGRVSHYNEPQTGSNGYTGTEHYSNDYGFNAAMHETHTFGPTSVLDVFFGRNVGDADTGSTVLTTPATTLVRQLLQLGVSPNFVGGFQGGEGPFVPAMGIAGYLNGSGGGQNVQNTRYADNWMFGGNFTHIAGKQTIKFGATFSTNNTLSPIYSLSENFAATQTQNPQNPNGTGDALASFLLGLPDSANRRNVLETEHGGWVNGVYLQDQIKLTSRLTLNVGVRWDVTLWPIYGNPPAPDAYVGDLNLNNGTYILANEPGPCTATQGYPCIPGGTLPAHVTVTPHGNHAIYSNDYGDWQPRAGLAYRLTDKTALRAGYGRFYDNWNSIIQLAQNYEGTWPDVGQLIAQNLNHPGTTSATITDPFNQGSGGVVHPALTPFASSGFVNWYIDPTGYKMPYSDQWNVGVEQSLGSNTVLSLAYVGSHDARLNQGGQGNTATYAAPGNAAQVAARQPYPYITPTFYDRSIGQSKYNSFQFRLQQRATNGLSYIISYTRSKSMDQGCSGSFGSEGCENQFPYDINLDRSVSGFDLPNIFSGSFVYDVPVGTGKSFSTHNRFVDYLVGNWQLGGILTLHSGTPFDVLVSNGDLANTGNTVERANLLLPNNVYAQGLGPTVYLNTAAFGVPAPYTFGNLGRNTLRTDSWKNLDLSLTRRFPIKERLNLEFRADAFNISNSVVFAQPDSTLGDANFGVITGTANNPREVQFSLKLLF
jgi:outer membrane receptor protein involved in Fe transport